MKRKRGVNFGGKVLVFEKGVFIMFNILIIVQLLLNFIFYSTLHTLVITKL